MASCYVTGQSPVVEVDIAPMAHKKDVNFTTGLAPY